MVDTGDIKDRKEVLRLFVKMLKGKYGDKIDRIILFGSVARGEDRETSDIDVLIVSNFDSFKMQKQISDIVVEILLSTGVYVSAKVLSSEEYNFLKRINSSFYRNALKEGIVVG